MSFKLFMLCQIFINAHQTVTIYGFSSGAPNQACMYEGMPNHKLISSQSLDTFPYNVTATDFTYKNDSTIIVTVEGGAFSYLGFFIRAKDCETNNTIGYFEATEEASPIDECSACTHTNPLIKYNSTLTWKYFGNLSGNVYFISTVVQSFNNFWVGYVTQNLD